MKEKSARITVRLTPYQENILNEIVERCNDPKITISKIIQFGIDRCISDYEKLFKLKEQSIENQS